MSNDLRSSNVADLTPSGPLTGAELIPGERNGTDIKITAAQIATYAGGGGAGSLRVVQFPFAFNTPNIRTGVSVLPAAQLPAGTLIWFAVASLSVAFDGTGPRLHFGNVFNGAFSDVAAGGPQSLTALLDAADVTVGGWATSVHGGVDTGGPWVTDGLAALAIALDGTNGPYDGSDPGCTQGAGIARFMISVAL